MPRLDTAQDTLFYARRGRGHPALVCIHGAGGTHQHWGWQIGGLSDMTAVLALSLPGHGRAAGPHRHRIAEYGAVVLDALDALALGSVVLAGHSMGGAIALWLALHQPERVAGLVLISTGAKLPIPAALLAEMARAPIRAVRQIAANVYHPDTSANLRQAGEVAFLQADPVVFRDDLLACSSFDVRERLDEICCPTLILCGADDQMTPARCSQFLHQRIAHAELLIVEQAGHMLPIEQPDMVNAALRRWFTSQYRTD